MTDIIVVIVLLGIFAVAIVARRRQQAGRRRRATTVELVIDDEHVHRRLGDGREESARWADVISVEVICTPVKTADGARAFVLLAEGAESGCLVPLGVGYDDDLVRQLVRFRRMRLQDFTAAQEHKPPRRTMVWVREELAGPAEPA